MNTTERHAYLIKDGANLRVPCSRYGRNTEDCSWWAIACQQIFDNCNGQDDDTKEGLDYYMGLAVNDSDTMAEFVYENRYAVTRTVLRHLGGLRTIKEIL